MSVSGGQRGVRRDVARQVGKRTAAFELEVEVTWARLTAKPTEVWLTTDWMLARRPMPGAIEVGTYTAAVPLGDFRADCFHVLGKKP